MAHSAGLLACRGGPGRRPSTLFLSFLAVVVLRSSTTTARENFRGGEAAPNPTK